ncbi:hypothetical protein [Photorhabdus temperata]|uniref:hypothetical protein n=1 Tax=Photorhabdus temperata TaxID=574560 RepID=UPI00038A1736|nr:hypothetical protein [Photorhabdus temperata]EQC01323.1 hypothetical protein B738_05011 [Photorhabdus temperata subsp. temperata M1021]
MGIKALSRRLFYGENPKNTIIKKRIKRLIWRDLSSEKKGEIIRENRVSKDKKQVLKSGKNNGENFIPIKTIN